MGGAAARMTLGACKRVLAVRSDIGMGKGKVAAQCAHAALHAYRSTVASSVPRHARALQSWEFLGETKVVVRVASEEEL